ncbi:unnamed protein product [Linum tenue]|uniref:Uncharacterized protein n=1 Tax=Linum tenue TaxID=586396 RepID=A0AAV0PIH6_9ROSI|nr:unnamed protein product [Linum tenue]CAI0472151.1 unnamed protein product [Linum tenue]
MKVDILIILIVTNVFLLSLSPQPAAAARRHYSSSNVTAEIQGKHATLTLNGFQKGEDGGGASECDGRYHSDDKKVVALSSNWYQNGKLCHECIEITAKETGETTTAIVVDECDTSGGCKHDIVDGSRAVWEALGFHHGKGEYGETSVTWKMC